MPTTRFDVAVIGGGIAGTSVAYFLSRRASVLVLEKESTLGYHSTGRSAAVFTECYGKPVVRRLALASRAFLETPPSGFSEIPLLSERGIVFIATEFQTAGLDDSLREQQALVPSVRGVTGEEIVEMCPAVDRDAIVAGVHEPDAMDLDVHSLHSGYQAGVRANGSEIWTRSPVPALRRSGDEWEIEVGDDRVSAPVVVNAAGAWCDVVAGLAGVAKVGLVPKRRTAFTVEAPAGHGAWPAVIDFDEQFYFKPEGPSLLASPADQTPVEPHDVRHREEDVALGIERINEVTSLGIRSVQAAWAGLRSFVPDERPLNGWDDAAPGFYWLAGQGGYGIKTSPAMGAYAASLILDGEPTAEHKAMGLTPEELGIERLRS